MTFNAIGFLSRSPLARLPGDIHANGPGVRRGVGSVSPEDAAPSPPPLASCVGPITVTY